MRLVLLHWVNGLFIFIKTLALAFKHCKDPEESLKGALQDLYQDEVANRGICVQHLSVYNFFVSDQCDYQVNIQDKGMQLGITCLKVITMHLWFNICNLNNSWLANADVGDLPSQVKENIFDCLQYSCLHWLDHLCLPANHNQYILILGSLKRFFEGLYALFWIEVLSIMGMVPVGVPGLRKLLSWVRVSLAASLYSKMIPTGCRMWIQCLLREVRIFVIS